MKYRVNEIFKSLQGEGFNQGKEVVFLRLAGCNLSCVWCDTEYHSFTEYTINDIISEIATYNCKNILVTGGEPAAQVLTELLEALKHNHYYTAIESNGNFDLTRYDGLIDYISISPKKKVVQKIANEVRVVNDNVTVDDLLNIKNKITALNYYISPLEKDGQMNILESMQLLDNINQVSDVPWRLSLQLHKLAGIK